MFTLGAKGGTKLSASSLTWLLPVLMAALLSTTSFSSVAGAGDLSALIVDSTGRVTQVEQIYLEYTWTSFDTDQYGVKKYVTRNRKTDVLLFQDAGTDVMHAFRFENVDSLSLSPDRGNATPLTGRVDVIDRDGRLYECKLGYWPLNAPAGYLDLPRASEMIGLKRWLKGWEIDAHEERSFFEVQLTSLRAISFQHPDQEAESLARQRRLRELLQLKEELQRQINEIEREIDILIGE